MDKYFRSFRLLTHLGVNKIRATRVLNKIGYAKQLQKNELGHFGHLASSESCEPEGFVRFWNKKMVVVPVCLNGRCCYSGCVGIVSYVQR